MSTPYPPPPRRLMRDPSRKLIGGVCSGLAKYLNMDVNLVRILTVLISLFTGIPIVLYIIALFVLPEERPEQQPPYVNGPQPGAQNYGSFGYQPAGESTYAQPTAPAAADPVWGSGGAPWEQPQHAAPATPPAAEPTRYDTAPVESEPPSAQPEDTVADAEDTTSASTDEGTKREG